MTTGLVATALSDPRERRLSRSMSRQYLKRLDEPTANAVFGNVGSMISFEVGSDDAESLSQQLSKHADQVRPTDLTNLPKCTAYARLLINGLPGNPFSMQTLPPTATPPATAN